MFLALPGYGLVGYHTPLHIRAIFSCTIRTQQRYMHLPATRKKIAGVLSMRIPKQAEAAERGVRFLARCGLRTSSCSPPHGCRWDDFGSSSSSASRQASTIILLPSFLFCAARRQVADDDTCPLIDYPARVSTIFQKFVSAAVVCVARLEHSYTLVISFCYSTCSASFFEARL
jgi:hypothetical protein